MVLAHTRISVASVGYDGLSLTSHSHAHKQSQRMTSPMNCWLFQNHPVDLCCDHFTAENDKELIRSFIARAPKT